ncbi:MAG: CRISPR system precrRNA processing endoribonuclease RAMP protein Cas6 [Myxococcales bacterium]|nr:CRISPR system precrRNA processing endoribonuclease RAMP protein Cas6 [Myxococcales bacterium]
MTLWPLDSISISKLHITMVPSGEVRLPPYLGSTLRGGLGMALRAVACATPKQLCDACILRFHCGYCALFEPQSQDSSAVFKGNWQPPAPMIIEPPRAQSVPFSPHHPLDFHIVLVGAGISFFAVLVSALLRMGQNGLGRARHPFALTRIRRVLPGEVPGEVLFDADSPAALPVLAEDPLSRWAQGPVSDVATVSFVTPMRIVRNGFTEVPVSFRSLARNLVARVSGFTPTHSLVSAEELSSLLQAASRVTVERDAQQRASFNRYSNRQQRSHDLVGAMGEATWRGDAVASFFPLLRAAEVLHAGKSTMFGFGKIKVR